MDKRILKGGLIGGLIVFAWGMISWMVIPWHSQSFHQFKDEKKVYEVIKENALESGIYLLPNMYQFKDGMNQSSKHKQLADQKQMMMKGPVMFSSVSVGGDLGMGWQPFAVAFFIQVIGAALIAWMVVQARLTVYKKQVIFITVVGLLVGVLGILPSWNWWGFSCSYTLVTIVDLIIGWFLAGLAMGKFIKR